MTIEMDKQIIFENIEQWEEFCYYANSNLEWSNPLRRDREFETWHFNEFRKTDNPFDKNGMVNYLFIGIKGKKVYINVWASWCGPCVREMPELEKAYQKLKDKEDVVFLSITSPSDDVFKNQSPQDKDKATILAKAQELGVTYPVLFDVNDRFLVNYTIRSFPTHIFINSDGTISNQISGALTESALEEEISKIK